MIFGWGGQILFFFLFFLSFLFYGFFVKWKFRREDRVALIILITGSIYFTLVGILVLWDIEKSHYFVSYNSHIYVENLRKVEKKFDYFGGSERIWTSADAINIPTSFPSRPLQPLGYTSLLSLLFMVAARGFEPLA